PRLPPLVAGGLPHAAGRDRLGRPPDRRARLAARGVNFDLSPEHELIRETVRGFARDRVAPVAEELDRDHRCPYERVEEKAGVGLRDGQWVIEGAKTFITNAGTDISACVTITARTGEDEVSNVVVPNGTPGYEISPPMAKLGWRASDTRELSFQACAVPEGN